MIDLGVAIVSVTFDSKERIARSNIYSIFGKLLRHCTKKNDEGKIILYEAGLSTLVDEYAFQLNPYETYKTRGYQNKNNSYNPISVCLSLCQSIEEAEEVLLRFLNVILKHTKLIEENDMLQLSNYLGIIGYEINVQEVNGDSCAYTLIPSSDGTATRSDDISYLRMMLSTHHKDLIRLYDEATTDFGNAQYISCIDNCRSLFESFFKKLDAANSDYAKGILNATGEKIYDNGTMLTSTTKIYKYWMEKKQGANRFRLFQTMYSAMSGLGPHHEDTPTREDALLLFRFVEDTLLWCFRKEINC